MERTTAISGRPRRHEVQHAKVFFTIGSHEQFARTEQPLREFPAYFIIEVSTNKREFGDGVAKSTIRATTTRPTQARSQALTTSDGTRTFGEIIRTAGCEHHS